MTSAHGDVIDSPPYSPRDEDMFYLVSHSQQSLTGCLFALAFLLLLLHFFTGICGLSCGLLWNTESEAQKLQDLLIHSYLEKKLHSVVNIPAATNVSTYLSMYQQHKMLRLSCHIPPFSLSPYRWGAGKKTHLKDMMEVCNKQTNISKMIKHS